MRHDIEQQIETLAKRAKGFRNNQITGEEWLTLYREIEELQAELDALLAEEVSDANR